MLLYTFVHCFGSFCGEKQIKSIGLNLVIGSADYSFVDKDIITYNKVLFLQLYVLEVENSCFMLSFQIQRFSEKQLRNLSISLDQLLLKI